MRKTITVIAAAAFLATGTFAAAPAFAAKAKPAPQPQMHPLPAIGVLPFMLMMSTKENKKFKPTKPYGKNTRTSI